MVETKFIHTVLKQLEKYLVRKNNFHLLGDTYDLILFVPSDKYLSDAKYSLLISARKLNKLHQKDVIKELLNDFKEVLKFDEYNSISRLNIINSEDPFVRNLKMVFAFREEVIEINEIPVGGVRLDFAFLVKSLVLDKLVENKALVLEVKTKDNKVDAINAGIIRIENNFDVVHYTGKGLREIWKPDMTDEQRKDAAILKEKKEDYLMEHQYIAKTPFDDILKVR
jgi:hypothetical protein